jgi:hypothetical protein
VLRQLTTSFPLQNELLLLKRGGQVVYHGPIGEDCHTLVAYFELRDAPKISLGENPANWMLRVITDESMGDLAEIYLQSEEFTELKEELDKIKDNPDPELKVEYDSEFAAPKSKRRELINKRLRLIYWRSPAYNYSRIIVSLLIAFILGSVFVTDHGQQVFTEIEMRARLSVIFLTFIITGIMAMVRNFCEGMSVIYS